MRNHSPEPTSETSAAHGSLSPVDHTQPPTTATNTTNVPPAAHGPEYELSDEQKAKVDERLRERAEIHGTHPSSAAKQPKVVTSSRGLPTDPRALVQRYRNALAEALEKLCAFGYEADAKEVADRYSLVYIEPAPKVLLSSSVPPAERIFDEHTR